MPHGEIYVLEDPDLIGLLAAGEAPDSLIEDLETLLSVGPIVIRTAGPAGTHSILMPRSDCLTTIEQAVRFLIGRAGELMGQREGTPFAFLMHHFLVARSGAFAYGEPGDTRVHVDASWGIPDSLLYCPHDSFNVDLADPDSIERLARCKDSFIDIDESGNFIERAAGWNWDWKISLKNQELLRVAEYTLRLAEALHGPVGVMFFVGGQLDEFPDGVLPWWFDETTMSGSIPSGLHFGPRSTVAQIRHYRDIDLWENTVRTGRIRAQDLSLIVRPDIGLLRSGEFARALGEFSASYHLPVQLDGSVLSHVFYILRSMGVVVLGSPSGSEGGTGAPILLNKLVRDRIPSIIQNRSEDIEVRRVAGEELVDLLRTKLIEESSELLFADAESSLEEAADVYEALSAFVAASGYSWKELMVVADHKRELRGGFNEGIVLASTRRGATGTPGERYDLQSFGSVSDDLRVGHPSPSVHEDGRGAFSLLVPPGAASSAQTIHRFVAEFFGNSIEVEVHWGPKGIGFSLQPTIEAPDASPDQLTMGFELL